MTRILLQSISRTIVTINKYRPVYTALPAFEAGEAHEAEDEEDCEKEEHDQEPEEEAAH